MHIAFINPHGNFDAKDSHWSEHPDFGGQLVYVKEVAIALAALGHKIDIITRQIIDRKWPEYAAPIGHYPAIENVNILRIPCGPKKFLEKEKLWPYLGTEWVDNILNFYASAGIMPDVFSAHNGDGGLVATLLSQKTSRPFTFTGHSLGAHKMDKLLVTPENLAALEQQYHFSRRILAERISMSRASRVITSTQQERKELYGHRIYQGAIDPKDQARFAIIPPGVNRQVFSPEPSEVDVDIARRIKNVRKRDLPKGRRKLPLVLVSSRLDPQKNHIGIVHAFAKNAHLRELANLGIAIRALEDPLREYSSLKPRESAVLDEIIHTIEDNNLWECITAFPLNNQNELAAAYRVLAEFRSVFALAALNEPFNLAPLEAMSTGLPVVVTKNSVFSESLTEGDKQFGVLVDPLDPDNIAQGLLQALDSKRNWNQLRSNGIERVVSKYTWEQTAAGYLRVFEEIRGTESLPNADEIHPWFTNPTRGNEIPLEMLSKYYF